VLFLWALGLLAVVLLGARYLHHDTPPAAAPIHVAEPGGGASARLIVHVAGAVRRPGVYRLAAGSRVFDAVRRAGGARRRADLAALNLAAKLEDGRQVLVPRRGAAAAAAGGTAVAPTEGQPLDLNTASAEQLDQLDGIGPGMAAAILKYRDQHGGFGSVDELGEVPGIGEKRLASLREQVRV
jgi:competence protein ComEA